jgi:Coenzyme PQQ synthesis protein D (PqqD)
MPPIGLDQFLASKRITIAHAAGAAQPREDDAAYISGSLAALTFVLAIRRRGRSPTSGTKMKKENSMVYSRNIRFRKRNDCGKIYLVSPASSIELDGVAEWIWDQLEQPSSVPELARRVSAEYDVPEAEALADTEEFLAALAEAGALRTVSS